MLKEIPKKTVDFKLEIGPLNAYKNVKINLLSLKDTSKISSSKMQLSHPELKKEATVTHVNAFQVKKVDSLARKTSQGNPAFSPSLAKVQAAIEKASADTSSLRVFTDKRPFETKRSEPNQNFLLEIPQKNIVQHFEDLLITKTNQNVAVHLRKDTTAHTIVPAEQRFEGTVKAEASFNWMPGVLLVSLFTFSWIKMAYQKYVVQVVTSLVNYQASIRLLRDKNVLFRNMAFGLNFIFAINIGLFVFFLLQYQHLNQVYQNNFISVAIYSVGIIALYYFKALVCKLIGNVFMVKEQFAEYVHNIHLYNKNIGLFLFPVVIVFPYITNAQIKPVILYLGLSIIIGMSVLLIYRGFQIIMRNGVSTFYLILYLCAVEILPILLLIKYSYTSI